MKHNTRNPKLRVALIMLLAPAMLALAGCGGGGGSSSSSLSSGGGSGGVSRDAFGRTGTTAAAQSAPKEGSVTQSSRGTGTGENRISTTSVALNAQFVSMTVPPDGTFDIDRDENDDDDTIQIPLTNSVDVIALEDPGDGGAYQDFPASYDFEHPEDGQRFDLITLEASDNTAYAIFATDYLSQSGGDNYLAFGFWAYAPDSRNADAEVGVFADGVEFVDATASRTLPVTGTATYGGKTIGTYIDADDDTGVVVGDIELTATFGTGDTGTVSGEVTNIHTAVTTGADDDIADVGAITGASVTLDDATIDAATGFFTGDTEYCASSSACTGTVDPDGKWGGQFFGANPVDTDKPPRVGGTWGVQTPDFTAIGAYGASWCSATSTCP